MIMRVARRNFRGVGVVVAVLVLSLFGCNDDSQSPMAPDDTPELAAATTTGRSWFQLSASPDQNQSCGLTTDQRAYCWGNGYHGDGQSANLSETPVAVSGGLQFRQVSAGLRYACGVTVEFTIYCWGDNSSGQLGDNTRNTRLSPVPVAGGRQYRLVAAGVFHTCGLTRSNRVFCWGENNFGQLGDGTTSERTAPLPWPADSASAWSAPGSFILAG